MQQYNFRYEAVIDDICALNWADLGRDDLITVAGAYFYFSKQFCETVEIACGRYPDDSNLIALRDGECNTANLSPYPGIAEPGERMNHDEFMRRAIEMAALPSEIQTRIAALGATYLATAQQIDPETRIASLPSYEDGGLQRVFSAVLMAKTWDTPALTAFRHFLVGHVALDSDPAMGHGALCRHLAVDDGILPLWDAFKTLLVGAAPALLSH
jgi:hypothetical protein